MSGFAKKSLGQNFLVDEDAIARIASFVPQHAENVLEIGPGRGAITFKICDQIKKLTIVEKDTELAAELQKEFAEYSHVDVIEKDALDFDFSELGKNLFVVANLPYNVSTEILFRLIDISENIDTMILMFQKEVALRLAASSGKRAYGIPSIITQNFFDVSIEFTLSPMSFRPIPQVDSTVVRLTRKVDPVISLTKETLPVFRKFIQASFNHRRKTFVNGLSLEAGRLPLTGFSKKALQDKLVALGYTEQARPEQISIPHFGVLFEAFYNG